IERAGQLLEPLASALGEIDPLLARVDAEVSGRLETPGELQRLLVHPPLGPRVAAPRDDERRARLVDQDAVRLVDDGEVQAAQDELLRAGMVARQPLEVEAQARGARAEHE